MKRTPKKQPTKKPVRRMAGGGLVGAAYDKLKNRGRSIDAAVDAAANGPAPAAKKPAEPAPAPEPSGPSMADIMREIRTKYPNPGYAEGGYVDSGVNIPWLHDALVNRGRRIDAAVEGRTFGAPLPGAKPQQKTNPLDEGTSVERFAGALKKVLGFAEGGDIEERMRAAGFEPRGNRIGIPDYMKPSAPVEGNASPIGAANANRGALAEASPMYRGPRTPATPVFLPEPRPFGYQSERPRAAGFEPKGNASPIAAANTNRGMLQEASPMYRGPRTPATPVFLPEPRPFGYQSERPTSPVPTARTPAPEQPPYSGPLGPSDPGVTRDVFNWVRDLMSNLGGGAQAATPQVPPTQPARGPSGSPVSVPLGDYASGGTRETVGDMTRYQDRAGNYMEGLTQPGTGQGFLGTVGDGTSSADRVARINADIAALQSLRNARLMDATGGVGDRRGRPVVDASPSSAAGPTQRERSPSDYADQFRRMTPQMRDAVLQAMSIQQRGALGAAESGARQDANMVEREKLAGMFAGQAATAEAEQAKAMAEMENMRLNAKANILDKVRGIPVKQYNPEDGSVLSESLVGPFSYRDQQQDQPQGYAQGGMVQAPVYGGPSDAERAMPIVNDYRNYSQQVAALGIPAVPFEQFAALRSGALQGQPTVRMAQGGMVPAAGKLVIDTDPDAEIDSIPAQIDETQPAALNSGEFVLPTDVVRYFGTQYLDNLIKKARGEKNGSRTE